jgi:hypothetical protein
MSREEMRKAEMTWEEMGTDEINWEELGWAEKRREDMRWDEMRWDEMRWGEKGWEDTARHEMRWCHGIGQDEVRWDEMRWDEPTWDEIRWWEEMNSEKRCHRNDMSKHVKKFLLRSTEGLPTPYRHILCSAPQAIGVSILKLPPPACPGTTCKDSHRNGGSMIWSQSHIDYVWLRASFGCVGQQTSTNDLVVLPSRMRLCNRQIFGFVQKFGWWNQPV